MKQVSKKVMKVLKKGLSKGRTSQKLAKHEKAESSKHEGRELLKEGMEKLARKK